MLTGSPWQNPLEADDIDANGAVEINDAVVLIQDLLVNGIRDLDDPAPGNEPPPFLDASGDGRAGIADAIHVITHLVIDAFQSHISNSVNATRSIAATSLPSLLESVKSLASSDTSVDWNDALSSVSQWGVLLRPDQHPGQVADELGLVELVPTPIEGGYIATLPQGGAALEAFQRLTFTETVIAEPLIAKNFTKRLIPNDPLFGNQWHLQNTGQTGGTSGADANLTSVWDTFLGTGVVIGIVDDGLEFTHPDLSTNYVAAASFDFNDGDADPSPGFLTHGTSAAGVAAATGNNNLGVSGAAPGASLAGLRLIAVNPTDDLQAAALIFQNQIIDIYSNSWGPSDAGDVLDGPGPLLNAAFAQSVNSGRGGLGSIYVWAGGNGRGSGDNVNYDGYANSRYTIAVGAIDHNGNQSPYSESGAPLLVTAYSNGAPGAAITTTTVTGLGVGGTDYTSGFGGTSSATPLVSGVIALMLEANPNLGWRDVQQVLARSAEQTDPTDPDWTANGAGLMVNHRYGYGAVDALAAVNLAQTWVNVGPEISFASPLQTVNQAIPDNNATGVSSTITVTQPITVESVEVVFSATHARRGDLEVILTSPDGTQSILAEQHADPNANYSSWVFGSMRHMGETSVGDWTLSVRDRNLGSPAVTGTFGSWSLNIYGTSAITPTTWQNPVNPVDVSGDGTLTPYDALLVIYDLYVNGPHTLTVPPVAPNVPPPYLDVDGDNDVDQTDAVLVISALFNPSPAPVPASAPVPEGEPSARSFATDTMSVESDLTAESSSMTVADDASSEAAGAASVRIAAESETAPASQSPSAATSEDEYVESVAAEQYFATTGGSEDSLSAGDDAEFGSADSDSDQTSGIDSVFTESGASPVWDSREEDLLV